ncbi:MAG: M23 family metallopeptidase [Peptococcaceae bacterium]|nr:M23 family metallopeptidase [Peptococcaceae bacterium]
MTELDNAVIVDFPLRGEWWAPNTPGKKVPSHGTDHLGQRYAYDFLQVNWGKKGRPFYDASKLRYIFLGVPLKSCYCWGREVYAPCDGKIVQAKDGYKERKIVHLITDLFVLTKNALTFNPLKGDIQPIVGNYIIMEFNDVFIFFAHLQRGSIKVSEGQKVKTGELLGRVGHSGNSTAPHLHFHLMDSADLFKANGIPCAFREYEVYKNGQWVKVYNGVPSDKDRIRFCG